MNSGAGEAFFRVYDTEAASSSPFQDSRPIVVRSLTWPSVGASRTGITYFGGSLADQILFFAGTTLRVLNLEFEVVEESVIDSGEPVDIEYQDGSIWLAYPDRLVRSNPAGSLSEVTTWTDVPLSDGVMITAIHRQGVRFVVLDGVAGTINIVDTDGIVLLSWDAMGPDLERGDLSVVEGVSRGDSGAARVIIIQSDGAGRIHTFVWDLSSQSENLSGVPGT